jgi:hypothetical protein
MDPRRRLGNPRGFSSQLGMDQRRPPSRAGLRPRASSRHAPDGQAHRWNAGRPCPSGRSGVEVMLVSRQSALGAGDEAARINEAHDQFPDLHPAEQSAEGNARCGTADRSPRGRQPSRSPACCRAWRPRRSFPGCGAMRGRSGGRRRPSTVTSAMRSRSSPASISIRPPPNRLSVSRARLRKRAASAGTRRGASLPLALTAAASPTSTRCRSREASVRLAEQVPGDAGEVGAHRRHGDVRVA